MFVKKNIVMSALGITLVCHASNVFLVLRVPLSIIDAFSKSMMWLLTQALESAIIANHAVQKLENM